MFGNIKSNLLWSKSISTRWTYVCFRCSSTSVVLKYIVKAAANGLVVILITHNVHHAYPVGNSFTVLNRGKSLGTFQKKILVEKNC